MSQFKKTIPYLAILALVAGVTVLNLFLLKWVHTSSLAMFYLLPVVIASLRWGRVPAVVASILSVASFNFFIIPPPLIFVVPKVESDVSTFLGLMIVALIISALADKTKQQTSEMLERKMQTEVLRETEKLQSALLNSVSHDLRTPLVSVTGALAVLMRDPSLQEKGARRELIENAHLEAGRLNRLVGNLLHMSRVDAGKLQIHPQLCELTDVIGAALEQLKDKLENRRVMVEIPSFIPEIPMDPLLMTAVFSNVIDNAVKFSPSGAPIEISANLTQRRVCVDIRDQGCGIPEGDVDKVFDKFYRALHPKRVTGTGLGLSICKGFTEAHGGEIKIRNNFEGGGVTVSVILPLKEPAVS